MVRRPTRVSLSLRAILASGPYLAVVLIFFTLSVAPMSANATGVDYVFHNGRVFTADEDNPWAEAVAMHGRRIVAVGWDDQILPLAGPTTTVIDLQDRLMIPGLNDAHVHSTPMFPFGPVVNPTEFAPGPGPTLDEMLDYVEQAATALPPGTWLFGLMGDTALFDPALSRFVLDSVAPDHPVMLIHWVGHGIYLNSAGLAAAGIAEDEPDPFGGYYGRVPDTNVLDGSLWGYAGLRVIRLLHDSVPVEVARQHYQAFAQACVSLGITSIQDMPLYSSERVEEILEPLDLPIRVRNICFPLHPDDPCPPVWLNDFHSMVVWGGVKWWMDGTPAERRAALREPYWDSPGEVGVLYLPPEALNDELTERLHGLPGYAQPIHHVAGDRTAAVFIEGLEATAPDWLWRLLRPRMEHGDMLAPDLIDTAANLGIVVVQNPTHFTMIPTLFARLGPERMGWIQPFRSLVDAGINIAIGSDAIGEVISPFVDLMLAVIHPLNPSEGITLEEAVVAHTRGSAFAEFQEWQKGTIAVGRLADVAVLSQDIFAVPIEALPATYSVLTMVDGDIVHSTGELGF